MKPRITRLEAIKESGKALREGKPIPAYVQQVLNDTRDEVALMPNELKVSKAPVAPTVSKYAKKQMKKVSPKKKAKVTYIPDNGSVIRSGALTGEAMEAYNAKRRSLKDPSRYLEILNGLLDLGMKPKNARREAHNVYQVELRQKQNPKETKQAQPKKHKKVSSAPIIPKSVDNSDPWLVAKRKQEHINYLQAQERKLQQDILKRPCSCIDCKKDLKTWGSYVDHMRREHNESVNTPKIQPVAVTKAVVEVVKPITTPKASASVVAPPVKSITPVEPKAPESFSDRWIRLFSEKGYNFAMVEAFKREANKQNMTPKQIHDFLDVCKPHKHHVEAPVTPVEAVVAPSKSITIVENFEERVVTPTTPKINITPLLIDNARGEKVEINTIGRDSTDQAMFRKAVSANYSHRCSLTGDLVAIEAAHIQTHSNFYDNSVENGIMLAVGLHRLFDKGIMIIDPDTLTVHFTIDCFYKKHLEGAKVTEGRIKISREKLIAKSKSFSITVS